MKKFKRIAYIVLIAIVVILSLTIYTNANKNNEETQKEKVCSQIKYLETKLINLFNTMNNIKTSDYNIITTEISSKILQKEDHKENSLKMEKKPKEVVNLLETVNLQAVVNLVIVNQEEKKNKIKKSLN